VLFFLEIMHNESGFIIISREIIEHKIFLSEKMLKIFIWCIAKASYKSSFVKLKTGRGDTEIEVKRGQFIFGRQKAEQELSICGSTIYKIMKKLQSFGTIEQNSNSHFTLVTVCNYDTYQDLKTYKYQASNKQVTSKEQASNKQVTSKEQASNTYNTFKQDNTFNTFKQDKEAKENFDFLKNIEDLINFSKSFFESRYLNGEASKTFNELLKM
jgi:hypothetical protein